MDIQLKYWLRMRFGSILIYCDFEQTLGFFSVWE